jgi:hypothetical protein
MFPTSASRREKAASVLRGFPRNALSRGRRRRDPVRAGLLECRSGFEPCHNRGEPVGALLDPALPDRERVPQCGYSALRSEPIPSAARVPCRTRPGKGLCRPVQTCSIANSRTQRLSSLRNPQLEEANHFEFQALLAWTLLWALKKMSRAGGTCSRARGQFLRREGARPR